MSKRIIALFLLLGLAVLPACKPQTLTSILLSATEQNAIEDIILASAQVSLDSLGLTNEALNPVSDTSQPLDAFFGGILNLFKIDYGSLQNIALLMEGGLTGQYEIDMSKEGGDRLKKTASVPTDAVHVDYRNAAEGSLLKNLGFISPKGRWNWEDKSLRKEVRVYGGNTVFSPYPATAWLDLTKKAGFGSSQDTLTVIANTFDFSVAQEGQFLLIPDQFTVTSDTLPSLAVCSTILLEPDTENDAIYLGLRGDFTLQIKGIKGSFSSPFEIAPRKVEVSPGVAFAAGLIEQIHSFY